MRLLKISLGWAGLCIVIEYSLVIIFIEDPFGLTVRKPERQPPIAADFNSPRSFTPPFKRMQPQAGKVYISRFFYLIKVGKISRKRFVWGADIPAVLPVR